jgi:hypothetical protein
MTGRKLTTGVTLVALVVVLCIMAVWGYNALTAPVEDDDPAASTGPDCPPEDQIVTKYVRRGDVTVSVYNAGKEKGRAQSTMEALEEAGFKPGEVNNAPEGIEVDRAVVYTTSADDPDAELVALALGKATQVVRSDDEFGPGVDVVIGDKFKRLDPKAPKRLELKDPERTCDPAA